MSETKKKGDEIRRRGRPPGFVPHNKGQIKKTRNVTIDADVQEMLVEVQGKLAGKLGFTPTLTQTIKHLLLIYSRGDE